jgi:hypothetical protein
MSPLEIKNWIERLLTDTEWSVSHDCLSRALGYASANKLKRENASWRTMRLTDERSRQLSRRLELILSGAIRPVQERRTIPGGFNNRGPYPPRTVIDWVPGRVDDGKPMKRRLALKVSLTEREFHVEHRRV